MICYVLALTKTTLAFAYSFYSITTIFVVIGAHIFFKEKMNKKHLFGIALICLGLFLFSF